MIFSDQYCEILDWFAEVASNAKVYIHPKIDVREWDEQIQRSVDDAIETDDVKDDGAGQLVGGVDEDLEEAVQDRW